VLTLFVVPTAYTLLAGRRTRLPYGEVKAMPVPHTGAAD
jgi:hypothetical protein